MPQIPHVPTKNPFNPNYIPNPDGPDTNRWEPDDWETPDTNPKKDPDNKDYIQ